MRKFKFIPLLLTVLMLFCAAAPSAYALEEPKIKAEALLIADFNSGTILYEKNMDSKRAPASLTKIMTGLLAVEALESGVAHANDKLIAKNDALQGLDQDSSNAGIQIGEEMTFEQFLYCALVKSANEACNVIGDYIDGSISAFVDHMNRRAGELGCMNTHFVDPNGLSNDNYSSAHDMFLITREAAKHAEFMTVTNTDHYQIPATNMTDKPRDIYNSNALITADGQYGPGYLYQGAAGIKTGYTNAAGYCLVSTAGRNGIDLICVVMGCNGPNNTGDAEFGNFTESRKLYDWAFANFSYRFVLEAAKSVKTVSVQYAKGGGTVDLYPEDNVRLLIPNDMADSDIEIQVNVFEDRLAAPIAAGTQLGEATVMMNGSSYSSVKLVADEDIKMNRGAFFKARISEFFSAAWVKAVLIILIVFAVLYIVLMLYYKNERRKHLRERMEAAERRRQARAAELREQKKQQEFDERKRIEFMQELREGMENPPEEAQDKTLRYTSIDPSEREPADTELDELLRSLGIDKK